MRKYMDIPEFGSEAEEAAWWPQQEEELFVAFERAEAAGDLGSGTAAKKASLVLLAEEDADLASTQAARRGISVDAYVQSLLHAALTAEEHRTAH